MVYPCIGQSVHALFRLRSRKLLPGNQNMWPFRRSSEALMPGKTFECVLRESQDLISCPGHWEITDGGHPSGSVGIGHMSRGEGRIQLETRDQELHEVRAVFACDSEQPSDLSAGEIVIDSGAIVVLNRQACFSGEDANRSRYRLLRAVRSACSRSDVVVVKDLSGDYVAIVIFPALGDGAYGVRIESHDGFRVVAIDVSESH